MSTGLQQIIIRLHPTRDDSQLVSQALNDEAGHHEVTTAPRELIAAVDAGVRTWETYPYYEARYGGRGRRFTRSDSARLVTLGRDDLDRARRQIQWLGGLPSPRGMPNLLLDEHLFELRDALVDAVPERVAGYQSLVVLAEELRAKRLGAVPDFDALADSFPYDVPIANVGPILAGAVAGERLGSDSAVDGAAAWLTTPRDFRADWIANVPVDQTNLPGEWNPDAGMWIPRIAVYAADPDQVYNVLAKFGLGEVSANGTLVPGTERFTLIDANDQGAFMDDLVDMRQYHIIFGPCAATKLWIGAPNVPDLRAQNIRDYVAGGGKWYATDHSNEYIAVPFPTYQDFHSPAMPDLQPAYDSVGTVEDPELLAWLEALPDNLKDIGGGNPTLFNLPSVETLLNYSGIDAVHEVIVQDDEGAGVNVGPYTWVSGPCTSCGDPVMTRPMAISGQWGCGRMMYSTFENSSVAHAGLSPQELILLYMILEIGVCHDKPPRRCPRWSDGVQQPTISATSSYDRSRASCPKGIELMMSSSAPSPR